jgi:hypothetical protein
MTENHMYSHAPRCRECGGRAVLTQETALALTVKASGLEMIACPHTDAWHVCAPGLETSRRIWQRPPAL